MQNHDAARDLVGGFAVVYDQRERRSGFCLDICTSKVDDAILISNDAVILVVQPDLTALQAERAVGAHHAVGAAGRMDLAACDGKVSDGENADIARQSNLTAGDAVVCVGGLDVIFAVLELDLCAGDLQLAVGGQAGDRRGFIGVADHQLAAGKRSLPGARLRQQTVFGAVQAQLAAGQVELAALALGKQNAVLRVDRDVRAAADRQRTGRVIRVARAVGLQRVRAAREADGLCAEVLEAAVERGGGQLAARNVHRAVAIDTDGFFGACAGQRELAGRQRNLRFGVLQVHALSHGGDIDRAAGDGRRGILLDLNADAVGDDLDIGVFEFQRTAGTRAVIPADHSRHFAALKRQLAGAFDRHCAVGIKRIHRAQRAGAVLQKVGRAGRKVQRGGAVPRKRHGKRRVSDRSRSVHPHVKAKLAALCIEPAACDRRLCVHAEQAGMSGVAAGRAVRHAERDVLHGQLAAVVDADTGRAVAQRRRDADALRADDELIRRRIPALADDRRVIIGKQRVVRLLRADVLPAAAVAVAEIYGVLSVHNDFQAGNVAVNYRVDRTGGEVHVLQGQRFAARIIGGGAAALRVGFLVAGELELVDVQLIGRRGRGRNGQRRNQQAQHHNQTHDAFLHVASSFLFCFSSVLAFVRGAPAGKPAVT